MNSFLLFLYMLYVCYHLKLTLFQFFLDGRQPILVAQQTLTGRSLTSRFYYFNYLRSAVEVTFYLLPFNFLAGLEFPLQWIFFWRFGVLTLIKNVIISRFSKCRLQWSTMNWTTSFEPLRVFLQHPVCFGRVYLHLKNHANIYALHFPRRWGRHCWASRYYIWHTWR